ncbi:hypothetical protein [Paraburkholderia terricola]|uniref:Uncharacterized protein n=1 Tax=Paraburkholderia terricola TaxID=169427 RepID=A0ABU1M0I3_9BURK|nr:hypothetical protein [Paraburkholderia terricola]MDR6412376.1 hypothetical protein [Paraburkholderia terricola]MDR6481174.1 hypothetical protein [Paraburkholderia terricola]
MSALNQSATGAALALCQDAYGNMTSGQEARAFAYLRLAISVLAAANESADSQGDVRAQEALKVAIDSALDAADTLEPPFDPSLMDAATAKWEKLGINAAGVLPTVAL